MGRGTSSGPLGTGLADSAAPGYSGAGPGERATVTANPPPSAARRVTSVDVFRGGVMLFLSLEVLALPDALRLSGTDWGAAAAMLVSHSEWAGCTPWDLIQPCFMFIVGVSVPLSLAARRARGQRFGQLMVHSARRAATLIALGVALTSFDDRRFLLSFDDVLCQIGLGYAFVVLAAHLRPRLQGGLACAVLAGYWGLFVLSPIPAIPPVMRGVAAPAPARAPADTSFFAHWQPDTNVAARIDRFAANRFRAAGIPFEPSSSGYATLNFVPSAATMMFGLLAGTLVLSGRRERVGLLLVSFGAAGIAAGLALHATGICPLVKRLWTPAFTLFSAGCASVILGAVYEAVDVRRRRSWTWPCLVTGANSIAAYLLIKLGEDVGGAIVDRSMRLLPVRLPDVLIPPAQGIVVLAAIWAVLLWMQRRRIFLKV